jgi:hypothetical protein
MMEVYHILFVGNQDDYDCDVSRQSGWAVIQAITELAEALYSFIPGSAYPYSKPKS